jgi:HSP20 family protein
MSLGPRLIDEIDTFQKQISKFFGDFNTQMDLYESVTTPLTDFYENKDGFKIVMNLPGIKKDAINIESDSESMEIRINQEEQKEESNEKYYIRERRHGKFMRRINFPCFIDPNNAKLELTNGILTIKVPKAENAKRISLKVN